MLLDLYEAAWRPAAATLRRTDAEVAHARTVALMRRADAVVPALVAARIARRIALPRQPVHAGGVSLRQPFIVAAGLVKGDGFADEESAFTAVEQGRNIMPGWRSVPALLGAVELGSFTRYPRHGNDGRVFWRDSASRTMQNRVGLRNPGARAAARHLSAHAAALPRRWGVNLAVSPGVTEVSQSVTELSEAAEFFVRAFRQVEHAPAWYTLNLSCPNTDDDPQGNQTEALARQLSAALVEQVRVPVWVKLGPELSDEQLEILVHALRETGVRAIVATNTVARPAPGLAVSAGLSGAALRPLALRSVARLHALIRGTGAPIDLIASGGIQSGADWHAFQAAGARAAMIYSALVFRGPLAAALILREAAREGRGG